MHNARRVARDSDGIDITLAKPKADGSASKAESLPVEPQGKYEQPKTAGDVELGRGGMGRVLRLEDVHLRREVAVKELLAEHHPSMSQGPMLANLFIREAQVLAMLEHPGVVPIYELGRRPDGTPYYAMRKVSGRSFNHAIEACASLEDRLSLLPHLVDVAHTVGFAHARGVVHRDLKPGNVMVGPFGETLVVDWGLALVQGHDDAEGQLAGTPAYMSPEQVQSGKLDARSDVWSLGVMAYELLSGTLPFDASTVTETLNLLKTRDVPPLSKREPKTSRPLLAVVARALQRDPAARYQSGEEFAVALEKAIRERTPRPVTLPIILACVVVALGLGWLRARSAITSLESERETQRLSADDAKRARAHQLAQAAERALRSNDPFEADQLARTAEADGPNALARGVRMLTHERGVPTLLWKMPVEAGCARVAVTSFIVACSTLNGVELFDVKTGASKGRLSAGPAAGWLPALAVLSDDVIVAGADNRVLYRWELEKPNAPETVSFPDSITALAPTTAGVLVGLRDGSLFRQPRVGERVTLPGLPSRVKALIADGARYAVGGDAVLKIVSLDGKTGTTLDRTALALDQGATGALYAGVERSVLRLEGGLVKQVFSGHRDTVSAIAAGKRLASADADGTVRVWFDDGDLFTEWRAFEPGVQSMSWSTDDSVLLVAPRSRVLEAWAVPEPLKQFADEGVPTFQAFWSRGWLLTGLRDGRIRKIDTATASVDFLESKHSSAVRALAEVQGDGKPGSLRHLSGGDDGQILAQRWNGEVEVLDSKPNARVTALDVSADGERASWAFDDGTVVLYALSHGQEVRRVREAIVRSIRFSPDARRLAWGRDDKRVVLLDAQDGREQTRLEETDAPVLALRWAGEGVVTALANGHVQQWDPAEKRAHRTFTQARDRTTSVDLSPDGTKVVAGSDDGHVYVWALSSGELLADVPADAGEVKSVSFVGNDSVFAAGTDRRVHLWSLNPP